LRFAAPTRAAVDPVAFTRPPLSQWHEYDAFLRGAEWPSIAALNARVENAANGKMPRFIVQTPALLGDGLHYEQRIAEQGAIATRQGNWHDLLNALVWLRFPRIKTALNARQVAEIGRVGAKRRSRAQCALTHFDEAGAIVVVRHAALQALWDTHDWHGLFWRERAAWSDGRIEVIVFGHALLEHALKPGQLLVGKCIAAMGQSGNMDRLLGGLAADIDAGALLNDPQELRPLPLSGIPGWCAANASEHFYRGAPCFRPLRAGRRYPPPWAGDLHRSI
jgi:hypothetical protein